MNQQPILTGTLVSLRPLKKEDFEALYLCAADPLVWEQHPAHDRYKRDVFEKYFALALASNGALAAIENSSGEIIGSSRFYNFDPKLRRSTIGYTFLKRSHWGGKFNREMKELMLEHAFKHVDRVFFEIGRDNIRSRKAIERLGADLHEEKFLDGKPYCVYLLEKTTTTILI